jgi:hypothetical protein
MLANLQARFEAALTQSGENAVRQSLEGLSRMARGTPLASQVRAELARRSDREPLVLRAWLWQSLLSDADEALAAEAAARLAELYLQAGEPLAAAPLVLRLRSELNERTCFDGRTGGELLEAWQQDPQLGERLARAVADEMPSQGLEITVDGPEADLSSFRVLPVAGRAEGPLAGWTFAYDDDQMRLLAYTPLGRFAWEAAVGSDNAGVERTAPQSVQTRGHLVLVQWESRFQLISALTVDGGRYRTVVGGRSLVADTSAEHTFGAFQGRRDRMGRGVGLCGPLTDGLVCFQSGESLVGLDPWTGKDAWRRDHPAGVSEILSDDDYVVVRPYGQGELLVLRAVDGELVARRPLPAETLTPPSPAAWGRLVAVLTSVGESADRLQMYDPVSGQPAWERVIDSPVQWESIDGGLLLLVDGKNVACLVDPQTGEEIFRAPLPLEADPPPWESLTAWADRERVYLVLNRRQETSQLRFEKQLTGERPVNGLLCAVDRREARLAWSRDVEGLYVDPHRPPAWPVLILAARQKSAEQEQFDYARLLIDKRTGDVVHESRSDARTLNRRPNTQTSWRVTGYPPTLRLLQPTGVLELRAAAQSPAP